MRSIVSACLFQASVALLTLFKLFAIVSNVFYASSTVFLLSLVYLDIDSASAFVSASILA
uniref:Uncharacterized protein n=1 Tax=Siphoviridae sp. ctxMM9 TaxID=2827973 RepID=A0A8S5T7F4_9CAUD|nr:MAG TPA: hypothetical protein [Siphoviridae sp. ctxMM9]